MAVTQRQIADHLGLSPQAVNFALGHRAGQVSVETRQRVIDTARKLGYRSNAAAQAVSTGKFNAVGLLMSRHHCQSTIFGHTLRGLHEVLDTRGIHLTTNFVDDDQLTSDDDLPKVLGQAMVDGLLLNYTHGVPPRMVELIERHAIPAVWVNSRRPFDAAYPDDERAGYEATQTLLRAGHRRISYVDFTAGLETAGERHYSHDDRRAGYERAMRDADAEPLAFVSDEHLTFDAPVEHARRVLESTHAPTAIVGYCVADAHAFSLACAGLGRRVGRDLSMIVFDQDRPLVGPKLEMLRVPEQDLGRAAAEMLLDKIDTPGASRCPRGPCRLSPFPATRFRRRNLTDFLRPRARCPGRSRNYLHGGFHDSHPIPHDRFCRLRHPRPVRHRTRCHHRRL